MKVFFRRYPIFLRLRNWLRVSRIPKK